MSDRETTAGIRRGYDVWVERYDVDRNPTRDLNAETLRRQPLDLDGQTVLELGCGTGLNTVWLAGHARRVVAVDLAAGMLARARRRVGPRRVTLVQADVTRRWPLMSSTGAAFDAVVANLILEHVEDLGHVFTEARRVLRPGGLLYLSELHPYKQLRGSQARYRDPRTGDEVRVPAFRHSVSEYVNGGLDAGFELRRLGEWQREDDTRPRLLTLLFRALL